MFDLFDLFSIILFLDSLWFSNKSSESLFCASETLEFTAYPHSGQPFLKSSEAPVCPHFVQRTYAKNFPQTGQNLDFRGTSEPQFSQKNFASLSVFFIIFYRFKFYYIFIL